MLEANDAHDDIRDAVRELAHSIRPIISAKSTSSAATPNMVNQDTGEPFFDNLGMPAENLINEDGSGGRYILDGLNAERTLYGAKCIGDDYWFVDKVRTYAEEFIVSGRLIGRSEGVQFLIANAYIEGEAANACIQLYGGSGFVCEYDVERKFRETHPYWVAQIPASLILADVAEHVFELPRLF